MHDKYFQNKAKILEIFNHYFIDETGKVEKNIDVHDFDLLSTLISKVVSTEVVKNENRILKILKRCVIRRK